MPRFLLPFLLLAGLAAADPMDRSTATTRHPEDPSGGAAMAWSLLGTAVPIGLGLAWASAPGSDLSIGLFLVAAGTVIGPSAGQYYARSPLQASLAATGRAAGLGMMIWGVDKSLQNSSCRHLRNLGDEVECEDSEGGTEFTIGTILLGGSFIYSLIDSQFAVKRAQARNAARRQARVTVDPWLAYGGPGGTLVGGRAQIRF